MDSSKLYQIIYLIFVPNVHNVSFLYSLIYIKKINYTIKQLQKNVKKVEVKKLYLLYLIKN